MEKKRKLTLPPDATGLICAICTHTFNDPVCGHMNCKKIRDELDKSHPGSQKICCPSCKLKESGVNELSRNLLIGKLLHPDLSEQPEPSCKRPPKTATCTEHKEELRNIFCSICLVFICFKCFKRNHRKHLTKTRNDFLGELSKKTEDAKRQYQVQLKTLESNLLEVDQVDYNMRIAHNYAKQANEEEYEAELAQLNENRTVYLQSLNKSAKDWESDVAQFKEKGKQFKDSLAIAVPKLESETLIEDLNAEDLKTYLKNVDNVMNLLKTDIGVEHLNRGNKPLVPIAAYGPHPGSIPSTSGGTAGQAPNRVSPKSINKSL